MKYIQRQRFSFTQTNITVSLKILSLQAQTLSLCFKPASRLLHFSKINSRQENRSKLSFTGRIKTFRWNVFFLFAVRKMSKSLLKFCKLLSNLILGQIIVLNLFNTKVHKLNSRINYARLH